MNRITITLLAIAITLACAAFTTSNNASRKTDQIGEQLIASQTKKLVEELKRELDATLQQYETKLDEQIKRYESKMDSQLERAQQKLDANVNKVEARVDKTLGKLDDEVSDLKGQLLGTVSAVAWRFTITDIVTAVLATFLTAFFTAFLTARRIQAGQFRKEMEAIMTETRKAMEEMKAGMKKG